LSNHFIILGRFLPPLCRPSLSGISVVRDFVELPPQFNEHWALEPKVFPSSLLVSEVAILPLHLLAESIWLIGSADFKKTLTTRL